MKNLTSKAIVLLRKFFTCIVRSSGNRQETVPYCSCCNARIPFRRGFFFWNRTVFDVRRYRDAPQKVICPACGSLPRHRIIASWCELNKGLLKKSRILIFAPEKCIVFYMHENDIPFITADLFRRADLRLDIQDTGLPEGSFDIIFCNHVLEHVNDLDSALNELYRIVSSGGMLICSFPIDLSLEKTREGMGVLTRKEHIEMFGQHDHNRLFGKDSRQLLSRAGFDVGTIDLDLLPADILPVTGPADYDSNTIFLCRKMPEQTGCSCKVQE